MSARRPRTLAATLAVAAGAMAWAPGAGAVPPGLGGLTETQCITENAAAGCIAGDGLAGGRRVAVSPDGRNVYVASGSGGGSGSGALAAFARDPATGALTELNCVAAAAGAGCPTRGDGLTSAWGVAVSPDGATIYVTSTSFGGGSVAAFLRDPGTGAIGAQLDCVSETATSSCVDGHGLTNAHGVTATNVGVYVAGESAGDGGVTSFSRGAVTGALGAETSCFGQAGTDPCTHHTQTRSPVAVAVSPDGRALYAVSDAGLTTSTVTSYLLDQTGAITVPLGCVVSDTSPSGCIASSQGLDNASDVALAPDHRVYAAAYSGGELGGSGSIAALSVDTNTGGLTAMINCVEAAGFGCPTPYVTSLRIANGVAVSPDGANVYAAAQGDGSASNGAVSAFVRNAGNGAVGALINCIGENADDGCTAGDGIAGASFAAVSPDGRNVYVGDSGGGGGGGVSTFARELAPVCTDTTATVQAGATVAVGLTCADPNGDPITRSVIAQPGAGTIAGFDPAATTASYTANTAAAGTDTFTFSAGDGSASSAPATATITITPAPATATTTQTTPTTVPTPTVPTTPAPAPRNAAPDSNIAAVPGRVHARSLTRFTGTASDDGKVARVEIALVRATGGAHAAIATHTRPKPKPACRQMSSTGSFSVSSARSKRCSPSHWIRVTGTTRWTFSLPRHLPKGSYTLYSRATDTTGLKEPSFSAADHNRVSFTVR